MGKSFERWLLASVLGLFALYFLWETGYFLLDFALGLYESGMRSGPQLAYPISGVAMAMLFLALTVYFGRSAIRVGWAGDTGLQEGETYYRRLLLLCVLFLVLYYVGEIPAVKAYDPSIVMPLVPWGRVAVTAAVTGLYVLSRRIALRVKVAEGSGSSLGGTAGGDGLTSA